jgi:ABC-type multidrug transport system permease subunit
VTSLKRNTEKQHPLWMLTVMRWRIFSREPSTIFWTYAFPLLLAFALGIAFRNRPPEPVEAAVQIGPGAERLRDTLQKNPAVHVRWLDAEKAQDALRTGRVSVVVIDGSPRTYRFDPTRPESRIARAVVDDALQRAEGRSDPTQVSDQLVTEPGSRYIDFLIPGLLGFNLMSSGLWGVGFVIVEMRTRKLIKRMVATPMKKTHFLLSFVLMRAVFLLGELPILLSFAYYMFHVPIRGSIPLIVGLATLGSLMFAGMGLLVASRAQNTQTVGGLVNLMILPMSICSGVFFSSAKFPDFLQPTIKLMPLTALIDSVRMVMLDGASAAQVARPVAIMCAWGLVAFLAALKLFRWR